MVDKLKQKKIEREISYIEGSNMSDEQKNWCIGLLKGDKSVPEPEDKKLCPVVEVYDERKYVVCPWMGSFSWESGLRLTQIKNLFQAFYEGIEVNKGLLEIINPECDWNNMFFRMKKHLNECLEN